MSNDMIEQVKKYKKNINKTFYTDHPKLSVIILSFNHLNNVENIFVKLNQNKYIEEIIICEDGSIDGSLDKWIKLLNERKHILIRTHDFHEIRSYDRAIQYARGDIICLLQDDDNIIKDDWTKNALDLFNKYPKLGVLGGCSAQTKPWNPDFIGQSCNEPFRFHDPTLNIPFMFACTVNKAPFFIKKKLYNKIGGFDYSFSDVGNCDNQVEVDLCYRIWLNNYQVGLYKSNFDRSKEWNKKCKGGSFIYSNESRAGKNKIKGNDIIEDKYKKNFKNISSIVNNLNTKLKNVK
jgi:glycosyltransferase involved in cell wall biosynthesis